MPPREGPTIGVCRNTPFYADRGEGSAATVPLPSRRLLSPPWIMFNDARGLDMMGPSPAVPARRTTRIVHTGPAARGAYWTNSMSDAHGIGYAGSEFEGGCTDRPGRHSVTLSMLYRDRLSGGPMTDGSAAARALRRVSVRAPPLRAWRRCGRQCRCAARPTHCWTLSGLRLPGAVRVRRR